MNSLSTFLHTPGSYSNVFYDASLYESAVPTPPESGEQPRVTRRGRKPGRRRVFSVPSERLHGRLEALFNRKRGKLCVSANCLVRRAGEFWPGVGLEAGDEVLEASGVKERQFYNHLAELAPTIMTKRRGPTLDVWCRELAVDQESRWTDEELLAGVELLERQRFSFAREVRGFCENLIARRKYLRRKNIEKTSLQPVADSLQRSTLEKPGFRDVKSPPVKTGIREEEIPRPEGGLSWERRGSLSERDVYPDPSRLSGSARSAPAGTSPTASPADARAPAGGIFEFLDETGEQPERPAGCTALLRTLLPPLPSGPVLPRPDTETRIQGMAATQVQSLRPARVLDDSEDQEGTVTQRNGQPVGPAVRKAGGITMSALWGAYHRLMYRLLPTYLPTCSPDLRRRDGAALERIGRRYCAGESLEWLEEWLARNLTLYVKDVRRDGHPPRGFEAWLNRRVEGDAWVPDILSMLSN